MVFSDIAFWIFLPIVLAGYALLRRRGQNLLLLAASYVFYGWWDARFLSLILASTLLDYFCGIGLRSTVARRRYHILLTSVVLNLGLLGVFKYYNFFAGSLQAAAASAGWTLHLPVLEIVLPVGISFYTFQTMSYTIDVYRGSLEPCDDFVDFALFVSYFPQLVAGPIERASNLLPRVQSPRRVTWGMIRGGAFLILLGMVRKVVIADEVAPAVERAFGGVEEGGIAFHWVGAGLFALQIYCDFAGYTDIARGVSLLFGIPLMLNFARPYAARTITEFWRRWHISLSTWLRDYLYVPLGGNRNGRLRTYFNLMATMILGGLWHGASWTFVAWGALHGGFLAVHKWILERFPSPPGSAAPSRRGPGGIVAAAAGWSLTMAAVLAGWVFFRAPDFATATGYFAGMASGPLALEGSGIRLFAAMAVLTAGLDFLASRTEADEGLPRSWPAAVRALVYAGLVMLLLSTGGTSDAPFIYFQF